MLHDPDTVLTVMLLCLICKMSPWPIQTTLTRWLLVILLLFVLKTRYRTDTDMAVFSFLIRKYHATYFHQYFWPPDDDDVVVDDVPRLSQQFHLGCYGGGAQTCKKSQSHNQRLETHRHILVGWDLFFGPCHILGFKSMVLQWNIVSILIILLE